MLVFDYSEIEDLLKKRSYLRTDYNRTNVTNYFIEPKKTDDNNQNDLDNLFIVTDGKEDIKLDIRDKFDASGSIAQKIKNIKDFVVAFIKQDYNVNLDITKTAKSTNNSKQKITKNDIIGTAYAKANMEGELEFASVVMLDGMTDKMKKVMLPVLENVNLSFDDMLRVARVNPMLLSTVKPIKPLTKANFNNLKKAIENDFADNLLQSSKNYPQVTEVDNDNRQLLQYLDLSIGAMKMLDARQVEHKEEFAKRKEALKDLHLTGTTSENVNEVNDDRLSQF